MLHLFAYDAKMEHKTALLVLYEENIEKQLQSLNFIRENQDSFYKSHLETYEAFRNLRQTIQDSIVKEESVSIYKEINEEAKKNILLKILHLKNEILALKVKKLCENDNA